MPKNFTRRSFPFLDLRIYIIMSRLPNWVDDVMRSLLIQLTAHLLINQQQGNIFISETGVILRDNFEQEHQNTTFFLWPYYGRITMF